jgi:hypothetical protein
MSSGEARSRLAAQQAELVRALAGLGAAPEGFDPRRVQATAVALQTKRAMALARAWPALVRALGDRFEESFTAYASATPLPREGGPLADGRAFARRLARAGALPEAGRLEVLAVDLHHVATTDGLIRRRGFAWVAALLKEPRRVVVGVRLPWLGARWVTVPLGGFR